MPGPSMIKTLLRLSLFALMLLPLASPASAHPHVWVSAKSEIIYAPDGSITAIRHAWTFDDMYSAFAVQGIEQKTKGQFAREELAELAEVNVTSLKEFDFFSYAKLDGKDIEYGDPKDYYFDYKNETLTLNFTLPLKTPLKVKNLELEMYDPSYYVEFSFAEKDSIALVGAPAACKSTLERPQEMTVQQGQRLGEAFFNQPNSSQNWGAQFASKIAVKCP
jgi:ABC-type uncharacterized transport system substrate-binding protein